jgi:phage shock protein PspC (stress-responsive transcriptional regulator)
MDTHTAPPETDEPPRTNRFFTWLRALDVRRDQGWVGGVCAGIAGRIGVDPLLVRGIVVVTAVLGGPIALLYAVAWLLIPHRDGRLHVEEFTRGRFTSAHAGIAALLVLALLPVAQGFWWMGARYWGAPPWDASVGRALWTALLIGLLVVFVVWMARRAGRAPATPPAPADPGPAPLVTASLDADAAPPVAASAADIGARAGTDAVAVPPAAPASSSPDDLAAWKAQQAEWKAQSDAYRAQEIAYKAEQKRLRDAESLRQQQEWAAAAADRRRIRRLTRPRLRASWVFAILGLATVAGGIAALAASGNGSWSLAAPVTGLAVATLVVGAGIVVAGLARRRSGFLSFVGIVLVATTVPLALVPVDRQLVGAEYGVSTGSYAQVIGQVYIGAMPGRSGVVDVWQGSGSVRVHVMEGAAVVLEVHSQHGRISGVRVTPTGAEELPLAPAHGGVFAAAVGEADADPLVVRIWQYRGDVTIEQDDNTPGENR